jgi:hypothetical protein
VRADTRYATERALRNALERYSFVVVSIEVTGGHTLELDLAIPPHNGTTLFSPDGTRAFLRAIPLKLNGRALLFDGDIHLATMRGEGALRAV